MFKSAATKLAHNSTIPSFGTNKDLKPLQDLINAEKSILVSLQKLSNDVGKASEALRSWGMGEGEDLGDTLTASYTLLSGYAAALSQFASHEESVRGLMKAVRTREENLDDLKRRRRAVGSKADAAEKKLSKMSPEHKSIGQQTELLNSLQDEMRRMDAEITSEEAKLSDFKRSSTKEWMGLKFGAMLECSEKGAIVGQMGKKIIAEIPQDVTQPGLPRAYYNGHRQCETLLHEANHRMYQVAFSTLPTDEPPEYARNSHSDELTPGDGVGSFNPDGVDRMGSEGTPNGSFLRPIESSSFMGPDGMPSADEFGGVIPSPSQPSYNTQSLPGSIFRNGDTGPASPGSPPLSGAPLDASSLSRMPSNGGGAGGRARFATFPVKRTNTMDNSANGSSPPNQRAAPNRIPPPREEPPPSPTTHIGSSFIGREASESSTLELRQNSTEESFAASIERAIGGGVGPGGDMTKPGATGGGSQFAPPSGPPPQHARSPSEPQFTTISGLPPGAAPPSPIGSRFSSPPYGPPPPAYQPGVLVPRDSVLHDDFSGLAYMSGDDEPVSDKKKKKSKGSSRVSRHVKFGDVSDIDEEMELRKSREELRVDTEIGIEEKEGQPSSMSPGETPRAQTSEGSRHVRAPTPPPAVAAVPEPEPETEQLDEKALNAAAAREVSRELDSLMFSSPTNPTAAQGPPSPLRPPTSPFTGRRSVSPRPMGARPADPSSPTRSPTQSTMPPIPTSPTVEMASPPQDETPRTSPTSPRMRSALPVPPSIGLPAPSTPGQSPLPPPSPGTGTPYGTPYGTPMEYPRSSPMLGMNASNTSVSSLPKTMPAPPPSSANGKISAAAFRRQQASRSSAGSMSGVADTSPLAVKKKPLPSSPYPQPRARGGSLGDDALATSSPGAYAPPPGAPLGVPPGAGGAIPPGVRPVSNAESEEFDYLSAYLDRGEPQGEGDQGLR